MTDDGENNQKSKADDIEDVRNDDVFGFVYLEATDEPIRQELEDLDYQRLTKVARRLGFTGTRKPRSSMIKYIENIDADKEEIIEYLSTYGIDVEDVELESGESGYIFNTPPLTRLKVRQKPFCVSATNPKTASWLIEEAGYNYSRKEGIPCAEWMATELLVEHPSECGMPNRQVKTRQYYAKRLQEKIDLLRSCKPDDELCVERAVRGVRYFKKQKDEYPLFPPKKCYCGNFNCFQGSSHWETHNEMIEQKNKSLLRLAKLRERGRA